MRRTFASQSDLDAARRDARTTAQEVARDRSAVERVDRDSRHTLAAARKAVDEARAAVAQVDAFLSMTRIQSPIDGIVGQVLTQEGEQVVAELEAVKLLTVIDPRFLEAWVFINEADAAGVRPGMPVRLFTPFRQDQVFTAQVERLSPVPEAVDRVLYYPAIAPLGQEAARFLRPEMNVQCFVMVEHLPQALSVPNEAVMQRGGRRVVWVEDGRGGLTAVEPVFGVRGNARTQVLSGLETGQRVEGYTEIRRGLGEGEEVVTRANFLIDSESNLRAAIGSFSAGPASPEPAGTPGHSMHGGH